MSDAQSKYIYIHIYIYLNLAIDANDISLIDRAQGSRNFIE